MNSPPLTLFNSIDLTEKYYNTTVIDTLLNVDTKHIDYDKELLMWDTEQTKLKSLIKGSKKKSNYYEKNINYKVKEYTKITVGRMYPVDIKSSYQGIWGVIRRLVSNGNHLGIDIENAQPNILYQCCVKYCNYIPPNLSIYIGDRKKSLRDIQAHYNVDRKIAKDLIIRLCYGGKYTTWADKHSLKVADHSDFVKSLYQELLEIRTDKANDFPGFKKTLDDYSRFEKKKV